MWGRVGSVLGRRLERAGGGRRVVVVACGVAVLAAATALVVTGSGYPARKVHLLSGSAWLASSRVGQLTLLDGASVEVAAQVPVANPGHTLDAVQQGSTGYAVDRTAGTIRRVDGATFELTTPPATPIPRAADGLQAFAGSDALYALDTRSGTVTDADPQTLATRGALLPLAAQVAPQAVTLDDAGRLWVLDTRTGDLTWTLNGQRGIRRGAAQAGPGMLTLAGGTPVLIDLTSRTATTLDSRSGAAVHTVALGLGAEDEVQVSGSPHTPRLYVVASRGVLMVCDLTATTCGNAVTLAASPHGFGAAIEAGNRVFVPDYTTGQVWIVDLAQSKVVGQPRVLSPRIRFQLLTRDGVVFYNDPDSEHAGVIELDGGVHPVPKYDPKNPDKDLTTTAPPDNGPPPTNPPSTSTATPAPAPLPTGSQPTQALKIVVSKSSALVGEDITMKVTANTGPDPTSAHWSFGDGQAADGLTTSHHWSTPRTYQVSVQATLSGGQTATVSLPIQVTDRPQLTVIAPANGSVKGNGITCPPTCSRMFHPGQSITLTAQPDAGFAFAGWGGACSGTGSCTLTPDIAKTVSATFRSTSVTATASVFPSTYTGPCGYGYTFNFTGVISVPNGPTDVTFKWIRSDGATAPVQTFHFGGTGPQQQPVTDDTWTISRSYRGWEAVQVLSPSTAQSNHADFTLTCIEPSTPPTVPTRPPSTSPTAQPTDPYPSPNPTASWPMPSPSVSAPALTPATVRPTTSAASDSGQRDQLLGTWRAQGGWVVMLQPAVPARRVPRSFQPRPSADHRRARGPRIRPTRFGR